MRNAFQMRRPLALVMPIICLVVPMTRRQREHKAPFCAYMASLFFFALCLSVLLLVMNRAFCSPNGGFHVPVVCSGNSKLYTVHLTRAYKRWYLRTSGGCDMAQSVSPTSSPVGSLSPSLSSSSSDLLHSSSSSSSTSPPLPPTHDADNDDDTPQSLSIHYVRSAMVDFDQICGAADILVAMWNDDGGGGGGQNQYQ